MKSLWTLSALTLCISKPLAILCHPDPKLHPSFLSAAGGGQVTALRSTELPHKAAFLTVCQRFAQDAEFLLPPLCVNAAHPIKQCGRLTLQKHRHRCDLWAASWPPHSTSQISGAKAAF